MGKIFKFLINCLLVLIIIVLVAYFALRAMDKIRIYNVETGSMEDKIHTGDYILLVKKDNYQIGDVVTFTVDQYFITHRIISMENGKITTKGDANNLEDSDITKEQIVGKAIYWGGILNYIINYKYVIAAALVGLYLLSCYFGDDKEEIVFDEEDIKKDDELIEKIEESEIEEIKDEPIEESEIEIIGEEESNDNLQIEEEKENNEAKEVIIEEIKEIEETKEEVKNIEVKPKRGRPRKKVDEKVNGSKQKKEIKKETNSKGKPKNNTKKKQNTKKNKSKKEIKK